jgi:hypothetical protein
MRPAISLDESSGSTRYQADDEISEDLSHDVSFREWLGAVVEDYEVVKETPMATIPWADSRTMSEKLKDASELVFQLEARRRGYEIAGNILTKRWPSGKRKRRQTKT